MCKLFQAEALSHRRRRFFLTAACEKFASLDADLCNNNAKLVICFSLRTSFCCHTHTLIDTYKGMYRRANGYIVRRHSIPANRI